MGTMNEDRCYDRELRTANCDGHFKWMSEAFWDMCMHGYERGCMDFCLVVIIIIFSEAFSELSQ